MLLVEKLEGLGDICGARYDFENAGDVLPKHNHTEDNVHITIVARGKIRAYSHDWSVEATAGQILDFRQNEPHEFMALEDNTAVAYLVSTPFSPTHEFEINPLDEKIGINWGMDLGVLKISEKDKKAPTLAERLAEGKLPK